MPLQPPVVPAWQAGVYEHANPVTGSPSVVGFNSGIRDALGFLTARLVFRAHQTAAQSIPNAAWTSVSFSSGGIDEDPYSGWASATPTRYTAQVAGTYLAFGTVFFSGTATANVVGQAAIGFDRSSVSGVMQACEAAPAPTDNSVWGVPAGWSFYLGVGDYFTLECYQSTGGALNTAVATAGQQSQFDVYWLSA